MADIAFLLLIFFLVATSIEPDKGIQVLLPEYSENEAPVKIDDDRVLSIKINAWNQLMIEDQFVEISDVTEAVKTHVVEKINIDRQPIISILTDTSATYKIFLSVYDNVKRGYNELRQKLSREMYNRDFEHLDKPRKKTIIRRIPMIISEADYY